MKDEQDKKIRRLEHRILRANRVSAEELREIVAAPQLFGKINARIKLARDAEAAARRKLPAWSWRKIGLAFGAAAIFPAAALGVFFFPRVDFSVSYLTEAVAAPESDRRPAPLINESAEPEDAAVENRAVAKKTAPKNKSAKPARRAASLNPARKARPEESEPEQAFSPLAFAENLEEAEEAGQVIRVELSRSSLLALGVNPPGDDESLKVKTDLLIGADGVARGIRFVK